MDKIVLAIVGLAGAGKTEATEYLLKKTGWPKVYFGQAVVDETVRRGIPGEAGERAVREEFRAKDGMAAMAIANMPAIKSAFENSSVIIESMYSWEEYLELKKAFGENFKVLAIYSSFKTRAGRMANRPVRPLSESDLQSRDYSQIENLHQAGPIARADWTIENEGSKDGLYKNLSELLNNFKF
ncbi:MAG: AAA family ATPase [Candidatus Doudnabacteria bacterium]|nr:AAA family ATPase [Candidatus Doudnabacteria bacterium]